MSDLSQWHLRTFKADGTWGEIVDFWMPNADSWQASLELDGWTEDACFGPGWIFGVSIYAKYNEEKEGAEYIAYVENADRFDAFYLPDSPAMLAFLRFAAPIVRMAYREDERLEKESEDEQDG